MDTIVDGKVLALSQYPCGSKWRRWDLHVHTPLSALGNAYIGIKWADFVAELEKRALENEIAAIGVTDYMSIEGYTRLLQDQNEGQFAKNILLIPNIEFRVLPNTSDGKALNLHLLVNPNQPEHIVNITRALSELKFEYGREKYGCIKAELIRFARACDNSLIEDEVAYSYGINQFKPSLSTLLGWISDSAWLVENCLIGVANGKDGISGLPKSGFSAVRDEILRKSSFIFSGNPADRDYYIGMKEGVSVQEIKKMYGGLKPCIHGSDAHELDSLFRPDKDRFCWIKSDVTFNGLRQIIWEPGNRVHIGKAPPVLSDQSQIIKRVLLEGTKGWFDIDEIELNSSLVAIVGEKGTGKTAIADLIAFGAGVKYDSNSQSSFIVKGQSLLEGLKVSLEWGTGERTQGTLLDDAPEYARPKVRYLSQDFVERLCSVDMEGAELQLAIEEVLFSKLSEIQKESCSTFSELRQTHLSASKIRRQGLHGEIVALNREVERLTYLIDQREGKEKLKQQTIKEIDELKSQLPEVSMDVDKATLDNLEKTQRALQVLEDRIGQKTKQRRLIDSTINSYKEIIRETTSLINGIKRKLKEAETPDEVIELFDPVWNQEAIDKLVEYSNQIAIQIGEMIGESSEPEGAETIKSLKVQLEEINTVLMKDDAAKTRLIELQQAITEKSGTIEKIDREIKQIENKYISERLSEQERQLGLLAEVYTSIATEEEILHRLYSPLEDAMEAGKQEIKFAVKVGYRIDQGHWLESLKSMMDFRKKGSEKMFEEITTIIEKKVVPSLKTGVSEELIESIDSLISVMDPIQFPKTYALQKVSLASIYDWLFSLDHIELVYRIEYGGTDLEFLSPGTRGIALLVLYLMMDVDDKRPLIIDQPEGNLDSASVFRQLVPYIVEAKKRRQVILVTHNPNLVVATDAEQIIVASTERIGSQIYPRIRYQSGSLEHAIEEGNKIGTKEAVCILLEGGKDAFITREAQYDIK